VPTEQSMARGPVADVLGAPVDLLDPSEVFHEASKLRRHSEDLLRAAARDRTLGRLVDRFLAGAAGHGSSGRHLIARSTRNAERRLLPLRARTAEIAALARLARRRRSARSFAPAPIELSDLAEALRMTYGFSGGCVGGEPLLFRRPIPSPGGLYSLELYVVAAQVASLGRGLYHYEVASHELSRLRGTEAEDRFRDALTSLGGVPGCPAYVVVTSVIERLRWKYGARAYRLAMLEVGHAGQQLCLAVTALGLVGCPIQAFLDDEVADLLGVDGLSEIPLHVVGIGRVEDASAVASQRARDPAHAGEREGPSVAVRGDRSDVARQRQEHTQRGDPLQVRAPLAAAALPELRSWEAADAEMSAAFREIASARTTAARARLIALEARLGAPDATIRDYLRLSEQSPPATLAAAEGILLHWTDGAPDDDANVGLLRALGRARKEALGFLGLAGAPAVYVEYPSRSVRPITLLGDRAVQRKICLPADADAEALRHELLHAICAPPNVVIAEGLACLFASGARSIREAEAHLEEDARDRLTSLFRRRAPGTTGGEALRDEEAWLVYPLAGSFFLFLDDRYGREAIFRYASTLVVAGSEATAAEQEAGFAEVFGSTLDGATGEWWQAVTARGIRA
jgi:SagB-type dehydrogenase family enzyme